MKISGKTRVVGIFGDPIIQTLSPYMHNAAFESMGLDYVYAAFRVKPDNLKEAVSAIRAFDMPGVNITVPHKERVMEFLDSIDEEAKNIGAVNTIVNRGGRLTGYNTDGSGHLMSLAAETGFDPKDKTIVILGAGGSARAIAFTLLTKRPKTLIIANRTAQRATALSEEYQKKFSGVNILATGLDKELYQHLANADLLVNATSAGMFANAGDAPPISVEKLPSAAIVSDIVFMPPDTPLIKEAVKKGIRPHKGLGMLVCQGALSFTLWSGKPAPIDTMRFAAIQALEV